MMELGAILVLIFILFREMYQILFKILPNAIRQLREKRKPGKRLSTNQHS